MSQPNPRVPKELEEAIALCRRALAEDPRGHIRWGLREHIWAALGPRLTEGESRLSALGYRRRVNLEIAAVRRVLPVWEDLWPDDKSPHRVLEAAKQAMNGMLSPKAGQSVMGDEGSQYQDLNATNDQKRQDAADVGYAAIAALVEALWDERFDPNNIQSDLEDRYFDILEEDASWIASKVIAGGREDHPDWSAFPDDSDHAKRREFWTWWLDEAVPAAWASEPE